MSILYGLLGHKNLGLGRRTLPPPPKRLVSVMFPREHATHPALIVQKYILTLAMNMVNFLWGTDLNRPSVILWLSSFFYIIY